MMVNKYARMVETMMDDIFGLFIIIYFISYKIWDVTVVSWIADTGSKGYPLFRFGMGSEGG